ncbi:type II toxin-antitoxin system RelE/ParE family toxin [Jiella sp. MQZ13P-4]|uniref:Type II toxin-antitoxin system RelE/ParE family toxin n=1 Tax=Jiella sonneratiae TaxID=2816856 RepID=A0ABS3J7M8_9HYPH|nr:type II toxin-antitoxin system RelE/ParE family toxin [Jiella sonneratiae]
MTRPRQIRSERSVSTRSSPTCVRGTQIAWRGTIETACRRFSPEALQDLRDLYDFVADRAGPAVAIRYVERIETSCRAMATAAERGQRRDDIRPGLRIVGFERRVIRFPADHVVMPETTTLIRRAGLIRAPPLIERISYDDRLQGLGIAGPDPAPVLWRPGLGEIVRLTGWRAG